MASAKQTYARKHCGDDIDKARVELDKLEIAETQKACLLHVATVAALIGSMAAKLAEAKGD